MHVDRMPLDTRGRGRPYASMEQSGLEFIVRVDDQADAETWVEVHIVAKAFEWMVAGYVAERTKQLAAGCEEDNEPVFSMTCNVHQDELELFTTFLNALSERREHGHG